MKANWGVTVQQEMALCSGPAEHGSHPGCSREGGRRLQRHEHTSDPAPLFTERSRTPGSSRPNTWGLDRLGQGGGLSVPTPQSTPSGVARASVLRTDGHIQMVGKGGKATLL